MSFFTPPETKITIKRGDEKKEIAVFDPPPKELVTDAELDRAAIALGMEIMRWVRERAEKDRRGAF